MAQLVPLIRMFSMADACTTSVKASLSARGPSFIEGISKSSLVKQASNLKGSSVKAVRIEHCERVHVITAAKRICITNCRECVFFLGVNQQALGGTIQFVLLLLGRAHE